MLEGLLKANNIDYDAVELERGDSLPEASGYDAVFVFGGPSSANDQSTKMQQELAWVKKVLEYKIPYMGICLGMQVLAKASGGTVIPNKVKEIGWYYTNKTYFEVLLTEEGKADPLFAGLPDRLKIFHLHGETVEMTEEMKLLAYGLTCRNQAVKVGENAYGIQGHFELDRPMFETWVTEDPELKQASKYELEKGYQGAFSEYEQNGKTIFTNFLKISKLIS